MSRKKQENLSRRQFLRQAGLMMGGITITQIAASSSCSNPDSKSSTAVLPSSADTSSPSSTAGSQSSVDGQYNPPDTSPNLLDIPGCTTKVADDRMYTSSELWVKSLGADQYVIGVTDQLQAQLGNVSIIDIEVVPGDMLGAWDAFCSVEGYKINVDLLTPLSGKVLQTNTKITPTLMSLYPYTEGWILVLLMSNPEELNDLVGPNYYVYLKSNPQPDTPPLMNK